MSINNIPKIIKLTKENKKEIIPVVTQSKPGPTSWQSGVGLDPATNVFHLTDCCSPMRDGKTFSSQGLHSLLIQRQRWSWERLKMLGCNHQIPTQIH